MFYHGDACKPARPQTYLSLNWGLTEHLSCFFYLGQSEWLRALNNDQARTDLNRTLQLLSEVLASDEALSFEPFCRPHQLSFKLSYISFKEWLFVLCQRCLSAQMNHSKLIFELREWWRDRETDRARLSTVSRVRRVFGRATHHVHCFHPLFLLSVNYSQLWQRSHGGHKGGHGRKYWGKKKHFDSTHWIDVPSEGLCFFQQ